MYSVVIPVYNAEKTLRRCVDSLLRQDCSEVELILVNDGSKDGSLEICREYARQYDCVRVIDKPNGGVSTARNAGLDAAQGIYVLFVDSDDYVSILPFDAHTIAMCHRLVMERGILARTTRPHGKCVSRSLPGLQVL